MNQSTPPPVLGLNHFIKVDVYLVPGMDFCSGGSGEEVGGVVASVVFCAAAEHSDVSDVCREQLVHAGNNPRNDFRHC